MLKSFFFYLIRIYKVQSTKNYIPIKLKLASEVVRRLLQNPKKYKVSTLTRYLEKSESTIPTLLSGTCPRAIAPSVVACWGKESGVSYHKNKKIQLFFFYNSTNYYYYYYYYYFENCSVLTSGPLPWNMKTTFGISASL